MLRRSQLQLQLQVSGLIRRGGELDKKNIFPGHHHRCYRRRDCYLYRMLSSESEPADNGAKSKPQVNLSGLQKQVISLYRKLLRTCYSKDKGTNAVANAGTGAANINPFIQSLMDSSTSTFAMREKFRTQAIEVNKRDYSRIEHHIRQGEKYIKMLNMGGVTGISSSRSN
mmetsp:Transcript_13223/g.20048  ORF Transcript_13223/g.20048 Transcript_13223/m.20048 type:complete len:170 (+) Transcript_13223:137-646(+)